MIKVQNVSKRYRNVNALSELSLEIPQGSVYGLIGPNGAGKTTLLRILAALISPTTGQVWLNGEEVSQSPSAIDRRGGSMPDFFGVSTDVAIIQGGRLIIAGDVDKVTRRLDGGRQLEIRVLDRSAEAMEMLKEMSGISNVTSGTNGESNLIQTDFTGDDAALHRMLVELVTHDIPVISFAPRSSGGRLEEVFMSITEGSNPS